MLAKTLIFQNSNYTSNDGAATTSSSSHTAAKNSTASTTNELSKASTSNASLPNSPTAAAAKAKSTESSPNTKNTNENQGTSRRAKKRKTKKSIGQSPHEVQPQPVKSNLTRRQRQRKNKKSIGQPTHDDQLQLIVTEALQSSQPGKELQVLCSALQPDPRLLQAAFTRIEIDLHNLLTSRFHNDVIQIHCFGSTLNGMAFKDSDFDLYVSMQAENVPSKKLVFVVCSLMKGTTQFSQIVCIANAKVPIIKCFHPATGFHCDISFSNSTNGMGVYNTNALRHFLNLDYRLHPLAIILKYWMRTHGLSGTGRITNYCLFMMILFYVQKLKSPILPPLIYFQKNCTPLNVDFWNVAINVSVQPNNHCTMKVSDLVVGFFEFYTEYDFSRYVTTPLYAWSYERELFNKNQIPNEFGRYIDYLKLNNLNKLNISTPMCVQDPFNLAHNVGASCGTKLFKRFRRELAYAANTCRTMLAKKGESSELLLKLFNESAPLLPDGSDMPNGVKPNQRTFFCKLEPVELEMSIVRTVLARSQQTTVEKADVYREWAEKVVDFIELIFTRLFMFDVKTVEAPNGTGKKSSKKEGQTDIHSNKLHKQLELHGKYNVYQDRKTIRSTSSTYLKETEEISQKIFENKGNPFDLNCMVDVNITNQYKTVELVFRSCTDDTKHNTRLVFNTFTHKIRTDLKAHFQKYRDECLLIDS